MRIIYSDGISEDERRQMRTVIFANLITAFKDLLNAMATENIAFDTESAKVVSPLKPRLYRFPTLCHLISLMIY